MGQNAIFWILIAIGAAAAMAATKVTVFAEPGTRTLDTADVGQINEE